MNIVEKNVYFAGTSRFGPFLYPSESQEIYWYFIQKQSRYFLRIVYFRWQI